jgi:hypothetical protein
MRTNRTLQTVLAAGLALLSAGMGTAGAQQAGAGQDKPLTLAYQFPESKTLTYRDASSETQNMTVMGQGITVTSTASREFTVKPKGVKDSNFLLGITIDNFKANIDSPQGGIAADASSVVGKSFDMSLARSGKEIDTSGAAALQYDLGTAGKRNFGASFQAFFPDLPDRPVKTGDTWPGEETIVDKNDNGTTRVVVKLVNTMDGLETVDGYECARIKTTAKGTMTGSMEQSGTALTFDASVEGTSTWYFAIKEGIFVKSDQKMSLAGNVTAEAASLVIPITSENQEEIRLIKK